MNSFAGFKELIVTDKKLDLSFPMMVFYPTDIPPKPFQSGPYSFEAAVNAQVLPGRLPLVMISHGSGGSGLTFRELALYLAERGFVVGVPEHPFNNRSNNDWDDTIENLTNRPRHISLSIDAVCLDPDLNVKWNDTAVIGHSIGAYTALAVAGGIPHTKHQIKYDPHCKITRSMEIPVTRDSRIKLIAALAPAAGWFLSEAALTGVQAPILIYSGGKDDITPVLHAEIIKNGAAIRNRVFHKIVKNAGHFSFLSPFPKSMKDAGLLPALDPPGFNRAEFLEKMNGDILTFLRTGKNPWKTKKNAASGSPF